MLKVHHGFRRFFALFRRRARRAGLSDRVDSLRRGGEPADGAAGSAQLRFEESGRDQCVAFRQQAGRRADAAGRRGQGLVRAVAGPASGAGPVVAGLRGGGPGGVPGPSVSDHFGLQGRQRRGHGAGRAAGDTADAGAAGGADLAADGRRVPLFVAGRPGRRGLRAAVLPAGRNTGLGGASAGDDGPGDSCRAAHLSAQGEYPASGFGVREQDRGEEKDLIEFFFLSHHINLLDLLYPHRSGTLLRHHPLIYIISHIY